MNNICDSGGYDKWATEPDEWVTAPFVVGATLAVAYPYRQSIRLRGYDYSHGGGYFITICTQDWECLLGQIRDGKMESNELGIIAYNEWLKIVGTSPTIRRRSANELTSPDDCSKIEES